MGRVFLWGSSFLLNELPKLRRHERPCSGSPSVKPSPALNYNWFTISILAGRGQWNDTRRGIL
jgi:hypothetical protein